MPPTSILSMTGYGEAERALEVGQLRIEIRTVNNRNLNIQFRTPPRLDRHHRALERGLKERFARGQVSVTVALEHPGPGGGAAKVAVDVERARAYVQGLRTLQEELDLEGSVDVDVVSRIRSVFVEEMPQKLVDSLPEELLLETVKEAAQKVVIARAEEGALLRDDLVTRLERMESVIEEIERRAPERLTRERDRLRDAVAALLDGSAPVDEDRLAREVAHLAERWDIHEEVVRFRSHLTLFLAALEKGAPGGVGKRLGFIAQELLREANTIGSKANDVEISGSVVTLKEEIERVREQIENIE